MSHQDVGQMIQAAHLAREIEACVNTARNIGTGAFTLCESIRVTLALDECEGPVLTMMPVHDDEFWETLGKPHEATEFEFFRSLLAACLLMKGLVGPGGFTTKACRAPGPEPMMPEILTWRWTAAAEQPQQTGASPA